MNHETPRPRPPAPSKASPEILAALKALRVVDGQVFELRALDVPSGRGKPFTASGYFDDIEKMAASAAALDARNPGGVYFTLNPANPALLARSANRVQDYAKHTTADADIIRRVWLPIDIDPVRPSGISSSDAEIEAAETIRDAARATMLEWFGVEPAIDARSGNGIHLLYRIDLPNDEAAKVVIKTILEQLAGRCDTDAATIDRSVFNAARIWKLPGTTARKGDNTADRPHRVARIVSQNPEAGIIPADLILAFGANHPKPTAPTQPAKSSVSSKGIAASPDTLVKYLARFGISVKSRKDLTGGAVALLIDCPIQPEHGNNGTDTAVIWRPDGIGFECKHNRCQGMTWPLVRATFDREYVLSLTANSSKPSIAGETQSGADQPEWEPPIQLDTPNVPDFPLDALPSELWGFRGFCSAVAESLQVPIDMAAMLGLAIAGALLAKRMKVHVRTDWFEAVHLYLAIALPPGERKSATYRLMIEPLCEIERREIARMASIVAEAAFQVDAFKAEQQHLKGVIAKQGEGARAAKERASEIARQLAAYKMPVTPKLILDDVTPEAVSRTLSEQGGRVAIMSAEGDLFDIIGGRYSKDGAPNLGVFLKGHAGDDIRVDRVSKDRGPEYVHEPALTIALTAQPSVLHGLLSRPGFRGRGLLGRFCWILPESRVGRRKISEQPIPPVLKAEYTKLIEGLWLPANHDESGNIVAKVVELSPEGYEALKAFEVETERELSPRGSLALLTDWGGKLCGLVARLAGILHGMQHAANGTLETLVALRTVEAAIAIGRYLTEHAKAAFGEMGADPAVSMARRILDWLHDEGRAEFTKRDAHQKFKSSLQSVEGLDAPLRVLRVHGYIRERLQEREPGKPGRPGSPVFEVNPLGTKSSESSKPITEGDSEDCEDIERNESDGEAAA